MWVLNQFRNPILDSASQFPSLTLNLNATFWVVLGVSRNPHSGRSPAATCALGGWNLSHRPESLGRYKSSSSSGQCPYTQVICFPYFSSANIIMVIGTTYFSQRTGQALFTLGSKNILYSKQQLQSKKQNIMLVVRTRLPMQSMQGTWVQSLAQEDPLQKSMATYSSILDWKIPWTEKPGGLHSIGLHRVGHNWNNFRHTQTITTTKIWELALLPDEAKTITKLGGGTIKRMVSWLDQV